MVILFSSLNVRGFCLFLQCVVLKSEKRIKVSLKRERNVQKMLIAFEPLAPHLENHPKEKEEYRPRFMYKYVVKK